MKNKICLAISLIAIVAVLTTANAQPGLPAVAKKHTECFKDVSDDGKDHPFDAGRFAHCGKNYQDGFLKGCKSAGNEKDTCESAEDNHDNDGN